MRWNESRIDGATRGSESERKELLDGWWWLWAFVREGSNDMVCCGPCWTNFVYLSLFSLMIDGSYRYSGRDKMWSQPGYDPPGPSRCCTLSFFLPHWLFLLLFIFSLLSLFLPACLGRLSIFDFHLSITLEQRGCNKYKIAEKSVRLLKATVRL